jgi:hypothetical protein
MSSRTPEECIALALDEGALEGELGEAAAKLLATVDD